MAFPPQPSPTAGGLEPKGLGAEGTQGTLQLEGRTIGLEGSEGRYMIWSLTFFEGFLRMGTWVCIGCIVYKGSLVEGYPPAL